ncbi:MAG: dUTP diphosphatase [Clostridia bacterium]|nr:dUTP diphosphatase [Clostridia bacterium]
MKVVYKVIENVRIKRLRENAVIPCRATEGSAGADLYACINEPVLLAPGKIVKIPTGIAVELADSNYAVFLFARSGLGVKHGITLANGVGVVDSDYRGEICVGLCNVSDEPYTIQPNERIAQMVIMPVVCAKFTEVDELSNTARGSGGFGSSGKL